MHEAIDEGHVCAGLLLHVHLRHPRQFDLARVRHDERDAPLPDGALDRTANDRVTLGRIRTDDEDGVRLVEVLDGVRHRAATKGPGESGHRGSVAEPGAVVHVVRADDGAHELLHDVVFFVRAFRRGEAADRIRAVLLLDPREALRDVVESLVPGSGL